MHHRHQRLRPTNGVPDHSHAPSIPKYDINFGDIPLQVPASFAVFVFLNWNLRLRIFIIILQASIIARNHGILQLHPTLLPPRPAQDHNSPNPTPRHSPPKPPTRNRPPSPQPRRHNPPPSALPPHRTPDTRPLPRNVPPSAATPHASHPTRRHHHAELGPRNPAAESRPPAAPSGAHDNVQHDAAGRGRCEWARAVRAGASGDGSSPDDNVRCEPLSCGAGGVGDAVFGGEWGGARGC
ncbi:uncharacterized protein CC84DRAFT_7976 [Paraphaeosphaeria sporulosa]|uniref:Uncharacterized protein n=1 Tax=Paraphaeosphaeria sporulosa TaxID=1460663 RepID=A0A177CW86_9PLEO|nr:uncharacterized protein CC84DRAFT_7976 [Paraphaeosphaeria sporulosa]OAG11298.1 hypothetical protein CC84DRAFT_7976 [Paraphaeosphaeria sporulosa]